MAYEPKKRWKEIGLYFIGISCYLFLAVLFLAFSFTVKAYKAPSGSMKNTILIGDHFLINKFIYNVNNPITQNNLISFDKPKREDIIVFQYPEKPELEFIKRVVGVEGDVLEVRSKKLYLVVA